VPAVTQPQPPQQPPPGWYQVPAPRPTPVRFWWCVGRGFAWGLGVGLAVLMIGYVVTVYVAIALGQRLN
jgi:predicted lipid-binding transport protein (Tim44 family)